MHFAWAWYSRPARQQCAHTYIIGGAAGRARARAPGVPRVVSLLPSHAARTGEIMHPYPRVHAPGTTPGPVALLRAVQPPTSHPHAS